MSYSSRWPSVFLTFTKSSSLSLRSSPSESENLTRATSSGEEAWSSLYSGSSGLGNVGVTL